MNIREMRSRLKEIADELSQIVEKEEMTEEDEARFDELETESKDLETKIEAEEASDARKQRAAQLKDKTSKPIDGAPGLRTHKDEKDFRNIGEFFHAIANDPKGLVDQRLQQMKNGNTGGFAIPEQFMSTLMSVQDTMAVVRPKATVIPAGDPPDAAMSIPVLDQRSGSNRRGGVTVTHDGESDQLTESTANLLQVKLQPKKLTAYMTASNELLNNWAAASSLIPDLMQRAITAQEDTDFLTGDGVNKALGVTNSPAAINVARATANQIAYGDIIGMMARFKDGMGSPVWLANKTTLPQLYQIGDGTNNILIMNAAATAPTSLMGYPLIWTDRLPGLGTRGDLMLVDLSAYLIKDGSGPTVAISEHFRFQNDEVAFRIVKRVDGQPWLSEPIVQEGTTNTESPFIVLN